MTQHVLGDPPVFVVGSMRSGSTLLRLVLDSHERIAIGHETGFMAALSATTQIPGWLHGADWYDRIGWTRDEVESRLSDFYAGMFARYAAERGKQRWGEKTPFHTMHMPQMARVFPLAVFIGIVRHPGGVASSLRTKFHYDYSDALDYWRITNLELVRRGSALGARFALCRYEDLVTEPEQVTRALMDFLQEEWSPQLLRHHQVQREQGAPRTVEGHTDSQEPIDARRADHWAATTTQADRHELDARAGSLAAFLGYDLEGIADDRIVFDGLLGGEGLAARRSEWASRVDFDEVTPVVEPEADLHELAVRALRAEAALLRVRSRRIVVLSEALRRARKDKSYASARGVVRALRAHRQ